MCRATCAALTLTDACTDGQVREFMTKQQQRRQHEQKLEKQALVERRKQQATPSPSTPRNRRMDARTRTHMHAVRVHA